MKLHIGRCATDRNVTSSVYLYSGACLSSALPTGLAPLKLCEGEQAGSPAMTLHLYRHTMHRSRHFFYKAGVFFNGIANNNNIGTSFTVEVGFFGFNNAAANY